jgi:hypothetical protein
MEILHYRGVIEGFYGPMWSHEERLHLIRHLRGWNMNLYIYGPRGDPYQRLRWEAPYPAEELRRFAELAAEARRHGVTFSLIQYARRLARLYEDREDTTKDNWFFR